MQPSAPATPSVLRRVVQLAGRFGIDWFVPALLLVIVVAWLLPGPGVQKGLFSLNTLSTMGVTAIFFFYGLKLNPQKLHAGLRNWQLHVVVQLATFLLFPVMVLMGMWVFYREQHELLWLGAFYLSALPSTVSTSVVMVSIARGNIPAAIFNASLSGILGVFVTPIWMALVLSSANNDYNLAIVVGRMLLQVIAPVMLGVLLHSAFGSFVERHKNKLRLFDQSIILLIVYISFSKSFAQQLFSNVSPVVLVALCASLTVLFLLVYFVIMGFAEFLDFDREDSVTAVFCGSKKSLVHGSAMSNILFPGNPAIGIILLPVMLYHVLQLLASSLIAQAKARKLADSERAV